MKLKIVRIFKHSLSEGSAQFGQNLRLHVATLNEVAGTLHFFPPFPFISLHFPPLAELLGWRAAPDPLRGDAVLKVLQAELRQVLDTLFDSGAREVARHIPTTGHGTVAAPRPEAGLLERVVSSARGLVTKEEPRVWSGIQGGDYSPSMSVPLPRQTVVRPTAHIALSASLPHTDPARILVTQFVQSTGLRAPTAGQLDGWR